MFIIVAFFNNFRNKEKMASSHTNGHTEAQLEVSNIPNTETDEFTARDYQVKIVNNYCILMDKKQQQHLIT